MTPKQIKDNAPDGATHYRFSNGVVEYLKKLEYHDTWYIWFESHKDWITTFWTDVKIWNLIKPL